MKFIRTLHPVGQGAFFTEKIKNEDSGYESVIVYDCGSISKKEYLNREIEQFKKEKEGNWPYPFNLLFISHFDDDHVNGLKKLLDKSLIDEAFIEELVVEDPDDIVIDRTSIESLIKMYLIEKNPKDESYINESSFEDLIVRYSVDKYLTKNLIHGYSLYYDSNFLDINCGYDIFTFMHKYVVAFIQDNRNPHVAVIIPFLYPNLIKILLPEMNISEGTKDSLKALFESGIKIIGLDDNGNPDNPFRSDIRLYDIDKEQLYEDDTLTIKSFTKIKVKKSDIDNDVCWYYMPYNTIIDDDRKEKFLVDLYDTLLNSNGKIGEWFRTYVADHNKDIGSIVSLFKANGGNKRLNDCNLAIEIERFLRDCSSDALVGYPEMTEEFIELLKDLYTKASPGINGVTAINVNSLNVLSFCSDDLKERMVQNKTTLDYSNQKYVIEKNFFELFRVKATAVLWYKQYMSKIRTDNSYNNNMQLMRFSCLYTGDCVMEDHFFSCIHFCMRVMNSSIGLLQIPHHGRKGNYNNRVLLKPIYSSFINFHTKYKLNIFAKKIEEDFGSIYRPCFEITEKEESKFVQTIDWE